MILTIVALFSLAVGPAASAMATTPCDMGGQVTKAAMDMSGSYPAPAAKCCDPVTKACLPSCSIAFSTVIVVASPTDLRVCLARPIIPLGAVAHRLAAYEPGGLDPPPKSVV